MFLNILRFSASNVLKTFLNILVSIGCTVVIFQSHKPLESINDKCIFKLAAALAGKKQCNKTMFKNNFKKS